MNDTNNQVQAVLTKPFDNSFTPRTEALLHELDAIVTNTVNTMADRAAAVRRYDEVMGLTTPTNNNAGIVRDYIASREG